MVRYDVMLELYIFNVTYMYMKHVLISIHVAHDLHCITPQWKLGSVKRRQRLVSRMQLPFSRPCPRTLRRDPSSFTATRLAHWTEAAPRELGASDSPMSYGRRRAWKTYMYLVVWQLCLWLWPCLGPLLMSRKETHNRCVWVCVCVYVTECHVFTWICVSKCTW